MGVQLIMYVWIDVNCAREMILEVVQLFHLLYNVINIWFMSKKNLIKISYSATFL